MQESLIKLVEACSDPSHSVDRWLSKLENSKWLSHVHSALSTAGLVVECVERWEILYFGLLKVHYEILGCLSPSVVHT